jgi:hypothetical protein
LEIIMSKLLNKILAAGFFLASAQAFGDARVAVLHLAPFADTADGTAVNIAINGTVAFENVKFTDFVDYTELPAGDYTIDIIPVGASEPAITQMLTLEDGVDYTVAAVGNGSAQPLELWALVDENVAPADGNVRVRIVHAAPFAADSAATEVSIRTAGGDLVGGLQGVPYKVASGYLELPAGTYDLKVASNDGSVNYIDPLPVALPAGATITVFAFGDVVNQSLGLLAFPVGVLPLRDPVDNSANGWWNILEGSGQGFILQPIASQNRLVGTWYTYGADGSPIFLTFDSCFEDAGAEGDGFVCSTPGGFDGMTAEVVLLLSTGGGSNPDAVVVTERIGTILFELDCNDAIATVTMDADGMSEVFTGARLTDPYNCAQ